MHFKPLTSVFFALLLYLLANGAWAADVGRVVFVAGDVSASGQSVKVGRGVAEGELLTTGANAYLYIEMSDRGFLILRPNSVAQIITYKIDADNPANSRFKLELLGGVARHISGEAVRASRSNFRFNTPVAAIGVRGTDFTVSASQDSTRIAVTSGGVVVSPLGGGCAVGGAGPCDGPFSRELFANALGQSLTVGRGLAPVLTQGFEQSPDSIAPPRPDEPAGSKSGAKSAPLVTGPTAAALNLDPVRVDAITKSARPPDLIWGRWQPLLDKPIEVDLNALQANNDIIAVNDYYGLLRNKDTAWRAPAQSSLGFSLQQSQASILNETTRQVTLATLDNGLLRLDFAKSTFFTQFDLVSKSDRFQLQNTGEVSSDGRLYGGIPFLLPNNMSVRGALASDNASAAYLFQARLNDGRVAFGATLWGK
jgi:FecR protein